MRFDRTVFLLALLAGSASAQYAERPDPLGTGSPAVDASGRSIKNRRVRAIHTEDPAARGGTAYLFRRDPFLAYQLGRNLNFREFRERDGVFDARVSPLGGPMPDGVTAKITANNQTSCSGCHNLPQGNPGGGPNFHKDSGFGRNTPHYYGAGVVEMLALQVRAAMLARIDGDGNGWISVAEAGAAPSRLLVEPAPGATPIDYGDPRLSGGSTGAPALNNIFRIWYVDAQGRHVPGATRVDGRATHGYSFAMIVWGWGQGAGRAALNPTNRVFLWDPFEAHGGLESFDPTTLDDPDGDGVSEPSLAGAIQFPATHRPRDAGAQLDPLGFSRDDPDGDGHLNEISEGDLDLGEWFMLNAPRPAFAGTPADHAAGVAALDSLGCTACHVPGWRIRARDDTHAGDRRFFDLDVRWNEAAGRLEGRLEHLASQRGPFVLPDRGAFDVEGFFSDLRHHDMGPDFAEVDFGGTVNTIWRTPPLWGVGSSFPWGHDGRSLTLEHAIQRHGGEARASRDAWQRADAATRGQVLDFLRRLVLYDVETLPTDLDGDGVIASDFVVAGRSTGEERFNPEWLFRVPLEIQGRHVNFEGVTIRSFAGRNVPRAYGELLTLRVDSDGDGWPDAWDAAPHQAGFRDGVR